MRPHLLPLLLCVVCGEPQSYPYAIKATAEEPMFELAGTAATPYESITYTTKVNPVQIGKLSLNIGAKSLKQSMTVPSLRYKVEAKYRLDKQQQLERHFRQTGNLPNDRQALDMLVVVSASDNLRSMREKIPLMLTNIFSSLPGVEAGAEATDDQASIDWRIALVSADASDTNCLVIDELADLQTLATDIDGFTFSDDERVIDKTSTALGLQTKAICPNFLRGNALTILLLTSDKDHQCDADKPIDGNGVLNTRGMQTSYYCGSSLTRFHNKLKQTVAPDKLKLYALLDSKNTCGSQRANSTCYSKQRKQATPSCLFANPCYDRDDGYRYASANYRRASIFDLIRYVGESDYGKITNDIKENINSSLNKEDLNQSKPFIVRFALGKGIITNSVKVVINGIALPRKYYQLNKYGNLLLLGDVRKYFPAGSTAVVKYSANRPYKHIRLPHKQGVDSLLVYGADSYNFIAKEGLVAFQEPLALKSAITVSYEYEVSNTAKVSHQAHVDESVVSSIECCLSSNCSSQFSCQLEDGMVSHSRDELVRSSTRFTANYTFDSRVQEFSVPHNSDETSMFLKLGTDKCSKLDIDGNSIRITSQQAKDNCSILKKSFSSDDIELHYNFSRQDDSIHLQQIPEAKMLIKVNDTAQMPASDYLIQGNEIKFHQPLPTDAEVSVLFTP